MSSPQTQHLDAGTERLIEEVRSRRDEALPTRERAVESALGLVWLAAAVALAVLGDSSRAFDLPLALAFTVAYAVVSRVPFTLGDGLAVPSQLVFVPMLLLLPTPLVPLLVVAAIVANSALAAARGETSRQRMVLAFNDAAF